jgi:hypothetical protein
VALTLNNLRFVVVGEVSNGFFWQLLSSESQIVMLGAMKLRDLVIAACGKDILINS